MSKFKKLFPFIVFGLVFVTGIVLLVFPNLSNIELVFRVGLTVIGFIGFSTTGALTFANKKQAKREEAKRQAEALEQYNTQKQIYDSVYSAVTNARQDSSPKKVSCKFCNFIYNESEGKCPNCGAPPEKNS